ncbi:hypothetical protein Q3H58_005269 [Pseudomonas psychrotolerans]|nr:hypothetical protein [Pseudomonas psychrotolerans]
MVRSLLALLLLASASAFAAEPNAASSSLTQSSTTMPPAPVGADGFTNPLSTLKYNPGLDQREFERASLSRHWTSTIRWSPGTDASITSTTGWTNGSCCR